MGRGRGQKNTNVRNTAWWLVTPDERPDYECNDRARIYAALAAPLYNVFFNVSCRSSFVLLSLAGDAHAGLDGMVCGQVGREVVPPCPVLDVARVAERFIKRIQHDVQQRSCRKKDRVRDLARAQVRRRRRTSKGQAAGRAGGPAGQQSLRDRILLHGIPFRERLMKRQGEGKKRQGEGSFQLRGAGEATLAGWADVDYVVGAVADGVQLGWFVHGGPGVDESKAIVVRHGSHDKGRQLLVQQTVPITFEI